MKDFLGEDLEINNYVVFSMLHVSSIYIGRIIDITLGRVRVQYNTGTINCLTNTSVSARHVCKVTNENMIAYILKNKL